MWAFSAKLKIYTRQVLKLTTTIFSEKEGEKTFHDLIMYSE